VLRAADPRMAALADADPGSTVRIAHQQLLRPAEIGVELGNGQPLTKAQGRAFIRNLSRMEGHLLEEGRSSRRVLVKDFAAYETEGAGRYGFSDEDKATLRGTLAWGRRNERRGLRYAGPRRVADPRRRADRPRQKRVSPS
jgi:hypothetical protein